MHNAPLIQAYAITTVLLVLNLMVLWMLSGARRGASKVAVNPEDGAAYGVAVQAEEPPEVARALRAHGNAMATIPPFLLLALSYVMLGGGYWLGVACFALFTLARYAHSLVYLRQMQPARSIAFALCLIPIVVLMVAIVWRVVTWPAI
jgi:uncharacterized membrane protein YecN with MAPEG domain